MRSPLLSLLLLGCASGPALPEVLAEVPSPSLRVDRCRARTGLLLTPDIAAPWEPANPWEGEQAQGTITILWCGEGTLHLEEMVGTWGNTEDGMTIFATALDAVVLEPNQEHIAPLRGTTDAEGAVTVHGHAGETLIRETAYVLVRPADPPSEAARLCANEGGHLRSGGLLGTDACDLPTRDRGRRCDSDDRCDGVCIPHWDEVPRDRSCPEGLRRYVVRGTCSETTLGPPCRTPIHGLTETCSRGYPPMPERCE